MHLLCDLQHILNLTVLVLCQNLQTSQATSDLKLSQQGQVKQTPSKQ